MNRTFCLHCGNKTLKKVAVTVSEDGSMQMHFSKNPKVLNPRGLRVRETHTITSVSFISLVSIMLEQLLVLP